MADTVITRAEARAQGLKKYFTGKPCKHGHIAQRSVPGGNCLSCREIWLAENAAQHTECQRRWLFKNKETENAKRRLRWSINSEKGRAATKRWAQCNPDRARAKGARWERSNPDKIAAKTSRRRARVISAEGTHTAQDLRALLVAQNFKCVYCRANLRKAKRHVDHIQPLRRGGSNDRTNLQYLCAPCNLRKSDKDPIAFSQELGLLL